MIALLAWVMWCTPTPPPTPTSPGPTSAAAKAQRTLPPTLSYADVDVRFQANDVTIVRIRPGRYARPTAQPRFRGRFVAIVQKGKQSLVDVEFDFPLLAPAESEDATEDAQKLGASFRKNLTSSTTVRVPWPDGADSVKVWDSVTRRTVEARPGDKPTEARPAETKATAGPSPASPASSPPSR
jgi:hypothetical protein